MKLIRIATLSVRRISNDAKSLKAFLYNPINSKINIIKTYNLHRLQEYKYPLYFMIFILFNKVQLHFANIRQFRKLIFESSYNIDQKIYIILYTCFKALHFHVISCLQSSIFMIMSLNRNSCFLIFLLLVRTCWYFSLLS